MKRFFANALQLWKRYRYTSAERIELRSAQSMLDYADFSACEATQFTGFVDHKMTREAGETKIAIKNRVQRRRTEALQEFWKSV